MKKNELFLEKGYLAKGHPIPHFKPVRVKYSRRKKYKDKIRTSTDELPHGVGGKSENEENPLRKLCDLMGIDMAFIVKASRISPKRISLALSPIVKGGALADFLLLCRLLKAKLRLEAAEPLTIWIKNSAIDALCTDNLFRRRVGMCPCPRSIRQLALTIDALVSAGMLYREIAGYFNAHFVPTGKGLLSWTGPSVEVMRRKSKVRIRTGRYDPPITNRKKSRVAWRSCIVSLLLSRIFKGDDMACLRYGIVPEFTDTHVIITAAERMPACVHDWIELTLKSLTWFPAHQWGFGNP